MTLSKSALDKQLNREPLGELLAEAEGALNDRFRKRVGLSADSSCGFSARWIAEQAIRAVCAEIIRARGFQLPMTVRFASREEVEGEPEKVIRVNFGGSSTPAA